MDPETDTLNPQVEKTKIHLSGLIRKCLSFVFATKMVETRKDGSCPKRNPGSENIRVFLPDSAKNNIRKPALGSSSTIRSVAASRCSSCRFAALGQYVWLGFQLGTGVDSRNPRKSLTTFQKLDFCCLFCVNTMFSRFSVEGPRVCIAGNKPTRESVKYVAGEEHRACLKGSEVAITPKGHQVSWNPV